MNTFLVRIGLHLENHELDNFHHYHGPLFHRWLPDGPKDAIPLKTDDENAELTVWFERRGFVRDGWIRFDYERREVDPEILKRQAILDGGPLLGLLRLKNIRDDDLEAVVNDKVGDERYIQLGKKIAKLVYPPLSRLICILRTNYGQHWIRELNKWDSREVSLGTYCRGTLGLWWSIDDGNTWKKFVPTEQWISTTGIWVSDETYKEFLVEDDYRRLADVLQEDYEPSLAATTLALSYRIVDQGNLRHAIVEGVTALEVALHEFLRRKIQSHNLFDKTTSFRTLPRPGQVVAILATAGIASEQDIEFAVKAIELRNKIVHYGEGPPSDSSTRKIVDGLLRTVASLLPGPQFKFPESNVGNTLYAPEKDERLS